jgi:CRP-like cAMP-binding protein
LEKETKNFIADLPRAVRSELSYKIFSEILGDLVFFQNKPREFIARIGPLLKKVRFRQGDIIFHEAEVANELFWVKEGEVSHFIPEYNNFRFINIKKGFYFGDIDV